MEKLHLELFSFEAGVDHLPYYRKLDYTFREGERLRDLLGFVRSEIGGYGFDEEKLALRLNEVVIFENLELSELMRHFGAYWQIGPLSTFYAKKDLLLNTAAMMGRYDEFFEWASFVSAAERAKLSEYLLLNLISPMSAGSYGHASEYLGEGFFLYLKWLLSRHPEQMSALQEWLAHPQKGVLNFASIADMVYPKALELDEEMWEIMRDFVFSSNLKQIQPLRTLK